MGLPALGPNFIFYHFLYAWDTFVILRDLSDFSPFDWRCLNSVEIGMIVMFSLSYMGIFLKGLKIYTKIYFSKLIVPKVSYFFNPTFCCHFIISSVGNRKKV